MRIIFTNISLFLFLFCNAQKPELVLPVGHSYLVNSTTFNPNGKYILTASTDGTAKIWEASSGALIHTLEGPNSDMRYATFSPDGKYIVTASASNEGKTIIWEASSGRILHTLEGSGNIYSIATFSPDGKYVISPTDDLSAKVWETVSGKLIFSFKGHTQEVTTAKFSPDGKFIVTASYDSTAKVWDSKNFTLLHTLHGHDGYVISASFSSDGKYIVTGSWDGTAKVWTTRSGSLFHTLNEATNSRSFASFSPNGKYITTASVDGSAKVWDATNGVLLHTLGSTHYEDLSTDAMRSATFSPDGISIVTSSKDGKAKVWETETGDLLYVLDGRTHECSSAVFSPNGKRIVTGYNNGTAKIWETTGGSLLYTLEGHTSFVNSAKFSPNGKYILTAAIDGIAKIWELNSGYVFRTLKGNSGWDNSANFNSNGEMISITSDDGKAKVWETKDGTLLYTLEEPTNQINFSAFSPDGKYIVTTSYDKTAKVWNAENGSLLHTLSGHKSSVLFATFSPDGKYILTSSSDKTTKLWNTETGLLLSTLELSDSNYNVSISTFSPDGKKVVSVCHDCTSKIWECPTGKRLYDLEQQTGRISAKFSADGKYIITTASDTSKIWESNTGKLVYTEKDHFAQYSTDGKYILTSYDDKTGIIKIWEKGSGILIKNIKKGNYHISEINFEKNIVLSSFNSILKLTDNTGKELLSWIAVDSSDWVVLHPTGLFDASAGAMEKMYWVKGLEVIDFSQLKDRFWEPGLWEKVIKGEKLRDVRGMDELKLQPEVELAEVKDEKLPITLIRRDGGYGKVVVAINGKEITADARGGGLDTSKLKQTLLVDLNNNPLLKAGKENTITVKAWSADGFVEGRGVSITYTPGGDAVETKPVFFAVVCGINDYGSADIHLNLAQGDARSIAYAVKLGAENLFGKEKTFVYSLTSPGETKPTKENIQRVFEEIKKKAKPEDVLLLYLSGHGITWGGESGDFYYLTSDAYSSSAETYNDPAIRTKNTISTKEFTEWIKQIPALKQVMIIDACGSGKAVENLIAQRSVDASQIKAIDRMKDRTGMFIISGCAADKVSYEASRFGQGLLTYSILQGMKGAALKEDKFVDVNTIINYAREEVPKMAQGIGGIQEPQILIPKGGSFDIGILEQSDRALIPLANPKPVFVRSVFINITENEDNLNLSSILDDELNQISAKGINASLIFVDSKQYPDACKLSGTYKKSGANWKVTYKIKCGINETNYELSAVSVDELKSKLLLQVNETVKKL